MPLVCGDKNIATDTEGFLKHLDDWSEPVAQCLAAEEGIQLSEPHWELIRLIRRFYSVYQLSPAMRPLVKYARQELGSDKGNSLYFLKLFPGSPAKVLSKIAGLPRPENCL
ncbi:MAG TPA: sulfurtransferase TusE [Spongiibacteraceae bacterium]|nr:sulfurtransferase TusE [Spongiibacteraceae bacterium]HCS26402.1 sulfurtransferase TusE [Spongiibacteraceae bacterium]|tara:strand:+ start:3370 stop:3702 length:333 start_codon:yes stop_codon:yes gene_type:complete